MKISRNHITLFLFLIIASLYFVVIYPNWKYIHEHGHLYAMQLIFPGHKCNIDFKNSLTKVEGGDGDVIVNPDPMLVWPFTSLKEEQKVSYELSLILDDNCRKELKAAVGG